MQINWNNNTETDLDGAEQRKLTKAQTQKNNTWYKLRSINNKHAY